jgi:hypothetical protein
LKVSFKEIEAPHHKESLWEVIGET